MKGLIWSACLCLALLLSLQPTGAFAQDDKPGRAEKAEKGEKPERKPKEKKEGEEKEGGKKEAEKKQSGLKGSYAMMARECQLSEEQVAQIERVLAEHGERMKSWEEANGPRLAELKQQAAAAREAKDEAKSKEVGDATKALQAEQKALREAQIKAVHDVLTEDQKLMWAGFQIYTGQANRFKKADLTEEQKAQIRTLCAAHAKQLAGLEPGDSKGMGEAGKKLQEQIMNDVLTAEQREKMQAGKDQPKKEKPEKEAGEKPAKERKEKDDDMGDMGDI